MTAAPEEKFCIVSMLNVTQGISVKYPKLTIPHLPHFLINLRIDIGREQNFSSQDFSHLGSTQLRLWIGSVERLIGLSITSNG
ncbi:hypothetical protein NIES2100_52910 [Calothrix sp. NIES-2100]|uniref:hypothetical protein n=1 Tax=Calothrix sp. NIES-2100 TaxID=1954172 RepID=UPI000B5FCC40|nr:hypothetical protein NIES2100_52910 [Calothrix sp. NIES-2100]